MYTNPVTGEVMTTEAATFAIKAGAQLLEYRPTNPTEMEYFIRESVGLMEKLPDVMLEINGRRYAAERAYIARKQTQLAHYGRNNVPATFARAMADTDAQSELETWHNVKAEYHYAAGTERALRTKVNSMLNINRAIAAQFGAQR
ncbi:hypothetical protein [Microbacterium foliorum]|uniref:hypothetical protein n=1 Tax=Microbacterium foliorum TaxID=104336 RepID=UPI0009A01460|nr:hypothetical protein [Microbacterium foliorum]AQY02062.1 hypothetical protein B2G67_11710 [Microbacterium foliorum]